MEKQTFNLSGGELGFADLLRLEKATVKVDPELLKTLKANPDEACTVTQVHASKIFLGIVLNNYLKFPNQVSLETASKLESLFSSPSLTQSLPDSLTHLLTQETYKIVSELVPILSTLSSLSPIIDGLIGLTMESENQDSALINEDLFPLKTQGTSTTLNNIQSLLNDSKLAKKNSPSVEIVEGIQISGSLKDLIEESEKLIEKEVNCVSSVLKKTVVRRSGSVLVKGIYEILAVVGGVCEFLKVGNEPFVVNFGLQRFDDIAHVIQALRERTANLVGVSREALVAKFRALSEFEAKINQGAAKPRPLQLGKGSRSLYQYMKDTQSGEYDLTGFLAGLLASKNEERRVPKIAKGMRDYSKEEMSIRQYVFSTIREVFEKHMADELDTPVMELRETLTGKYGEEGSKLIYNIADQGGELLSLRYDLTVPFARYVAMNRLTNWKRFQIGKVYRRDQPQMKRGRYREFYQCDFDIVGSGSTMSQDAEVLKIVVEILTKLEFNFIVKINHRKLLDSILDISGVPNDKHRTVSSSIDKLDKEPWAKVRQELVDDKGITEQSADSIGEFVKLNGNPSSVLQELRLNERIASHSVAKGVLDEIQKLIGFAQCLGIEGFLNLDMSLARGLDYYTGLVYEAVVVDGNVGSIAGGGRYDELISRLNNSNQPTPAVGVSLGVERLFTVIEERYKIAKVSTEGLSDGIKSLVKNREKCVLVAQAGGSDRFNLVIERYRICGMLWNKGIKAETSYKEKSDPKGQAGYAAQEGIRWIVWVGESELAEGKVKIKDLNSHQEEIVLIDDVVGFIVSH